MSGKAKKLTHNQTLVLQALQTCSSPMTAYQIMDQLTDQGVTAPPTVYRALNQLIGRGIVHRIDSLNAYVACDHDADDRDSHDGGAAFAICQDCGTVAELIAAPAIQPLKKAVHERGFVLTTAKVELIGVCQACANASIPQK